MGKEEVAEEEMVFSDLPEEIQVEIFLKLPVTSISSCRHVCKVWRTLICSRNFVKTHIYHGIRNPKLMLESIGFKKFAGSIFRSIDYLSENMSFTSSKVYTCNGAIPMDYLIRDMLNNSTDIGIVGSCNGLICMVLNMFKDICIWNPSTGEYKAMQLPFCDSLMAPLSAIRIEFGFCYDCIADDYKLVRIADKEDFGQVDVYTLGSKSWKTIQNTNHYMFPVSRKNTPYFVNGALHWLGFNKEACSRVIVSFDASEERFVDFLFPKEAQIRQTFGIHDCVGVLEDCLSFVRYNVHINRIDVWVMQDFGVGESWTKRFSFSTKNMLINGLKIIWSFTNGELLMDTGFEKLLYDPKNDRFRLIKIQGMHDIDMQCSVPLHYLESLVSPNSVYKGIISKLKFA